MDLFTFLLTSYYNTNKGTYYRVYPEFNDYGGFDMKWEQIYPVTKPQRKEADNGDTDV
jgi:hypothetical protein